MQLHHYDHDGRARFVTFGIQWRMELLTNNIFRRIVANSVESARRVHGFKLLGYVFMPEHVHMVIVPAEQTSLGYMIGEIKRTSSREIHRQLQKCNPEMVKIFTVTRNGREHFALWQRRCYDHNCRSDISVWEKVDYCHNNPVVRGLVVDPADWEWSSYRRYQGMRDVPLAIDTVTVTRAGMDS